MRELVIRLEEARRADADLLARKGSKEEVTPVPDLKAIVSAKVKTKTTFDNVGNDKLETKTTDEVELKAAKGDEASDEVETKTTASSTRRKPTLCSATSKQNVHRFLFRTSARLSGSCCVTCGESVVCPTNGAFLCATLLLPRPCTFICRRQHSQAEQS